MSRTLIAILAVCAALGLMTQAYTARPSRFGHIPTFTNRATRLSVMRRPTCLAPASPAGRPMCGVGGSITPMSRRPCITTGNTVPAIGMNNFREAAGSWSGRRWLKEVGVFAPTMA